MCVSIEELRQRTVPIAAKDRRFQERVDRFRQNKMFQNNQRQFYRELIRKRKDVMMIRQMLKN